MFKHFFSLSNQSSSNSSVASDLLKKNYQNLVNQGHIQTDLAQLKILESLQKLLKDISTSEKASAFQAFNSSTQNTTKSIYLFGDVGRGKSMLMDIFYASCPLASKKRIHFHAFMQETHEYIHQWRKNNAGDPLPSLAEKIKQTSQVLCFDEFHVSDIADAMLLSRLFTRLFNSGIVFVATSNQHPDELYRNGLQRELFLPFIDLLKQYSEIIELKAEEDYRLKYFKAINKTFFVGMQEDGRLFLNQRFVELTNNGKSEIRILHYKGREIDFSCAYGDILLSSFEELCDRELGPIDYLEIAHEFNTILIENIPFLSLEIKDQVRRFVTLVDTLYDKNVKLICSSKVPVEQLFLEEHEFGFKRTQSRLIEMQSEKYFQRKHLA